MARGKKYTAGKKERRLKVYPKYFTRTFQDVVYPEIRLCGKWLNDLGFHCGESVIINCEESRIVITLPESRPQR